MPRKKNSSIARIQNRNAGRNRVTIIVPAGHAVQFALDDLHGQAADICAQALSSSTSEPPLCTRRMASANGGADPTDQILSVLRSYIPFYNRSRIHSALDYLPPATYEQLLAQQSGVN